MACSCVNGAEHWERFRWMLRRVFTSDFPQRMVLQGAGDQYLGFLASGEWFPSRVGEGVSSRPLLLAPHRFASLPPPCRCSMPTRCSSGCATSPARSCRPAACAAWAHSRTPRPRKPAPHMILFWAAHLTGGTSFCREGEGVVAAGKRASFGLSQDCAPGVLMLHVACAQRLLLQLRFTEAQDHLVEALAVLPFAEDCLGDPSAEDSWPFTALDVRTNYIRLYRALSYYEETPELAPETSMGGAVVFFPRTRFLPPQEAPLLRVRGGSLLSLTEVPELAWRPARDCMQDADCGDSGNVCVSFKCVESDSACEAGAAECPPGARCSSLQSPSGSDCVTVVTPSCIMDGELEAYHPRSECLPSGYPRMIKACSEMGTTLYPLTWSPVSYEERVRQGTSSFMRAFVLPVTLRLRSLVVDILRCYVSCTVLSTI